MRTGPNSARMKILSESAKLLMEFSEGVKRKLGEHFSPVMAASLARIRHVAWSIGHRTHRPSGAAHVEIKRAL